MKFSDYRDSVSALILAAMLKLDDETRACKAPERAEIDDAIARITTLDKRAPQGWRFLKKARAGDALGAVLIERFEWHLGRGSANLYRVYGSAFKVSPERFQFADTFGAILALACGARVSHSDRWARALGVGEQK